MAFPQQGHLSGFGVSPSSSAPYVANAWDFDGDDDRLYRTSALIGGGTGKTMTASWWFKGRAVTNRGYVFALSHTAFDGDHVEMYVSNSGSFNVRGENSAGTVIWVIAATSSVADDSVWHHYIVAVDLANAKNYLYRDGVDVGTNETTTNDTLVGFSHSQVTAGGARPQAGPSWDNFHGGCMADLWVDDIYYDITSSAVRDKWYNSVTGKPVNLGADGSAPGAQPLVYLGNASGTVEVNLGTGGNFTKVGVAACSNSPSD